MSKSVILSEIAESSHLLLSQTLKRFAEMSNDSTPYTFFENTDKLHKILK